jgi:aminoglycoside phosphotransferase family enzyme/predicted kinase
VTAQDLTSQASARIREALSRPESYSNRPGTVEVHETHISWVFLAGERVYKLKKPLVLDFLDYGTPARRLEMCREEVRLNQPLAPDVYVGVLGVAVTGDGVELVAEDDPRAVDYMVEMLRYDERETLAARLRQGELAPVHIRAVGAALAQFHADARSVPGAVAPVLAVESRFERNLHELLRCIEQPREIGRVLALERFAHAFITSRAATFQARATIGRIREGHGDLRAEHVLVDGGVRIVDCVEFDRELRELDVADDLAFLVFDLAALGASRLGWTLVEAYRRAGGDPGDDSLVAFYATYRALVRAKVALVRAAQLAPASPEHGDERAQAREEIFLAERFAWQARLPIVLVVCGVPASGKSHLAAALAQLSGLPHLSSDVTRKQLLGVRSTERAAADVYTAEWNARTYAELARRATQAVAAKRGAIVDATFRHRSDRVAFMSAFGAVAPALFIECLAPGAVLAERAARRAHDRGRVSDADPQVVLHERTSWESLDEVPAGRHLALRTDRPIEQIVDDVLALLDSRLAG